MKRVKIIMQLVLLFAITLANNGCEEYFEFSPYASNVKDLYKNTGTHNLETIIRADTTQNDEIRFAVIADSHYNYHDLNEAIIDLNIRDIDFVIANGDIADHGYLKEYELFHEQMHKLVVPYLTVIGNHDYRSNGGKIYKEMYGDFNKSFIFNNNLFVLFDDVFWESNKKPDMDWLENQLKNADQYDNIIVLCHIPPFDMQFTESYEERYKELMVTYGVEISIHGHIHRSEYLDYYKDGMTYLTVESIMDNEYTVLTVSKNGIEVENINY